MLHELFIAHCIKFIVYISYIFHGAENNVPQIPSLHCQVEMLMENLSAIWIILNFETIET